MGNESIQNIITSSLEKQDITGLVDDIMREKTIEMIQKLNQEQEGNDDEAS